MKKKKLKKKIAKLEKQVFWLRQDLKLSETLSAQRKKRVVQLSGPRVRFICNSCGCLVAHDSLSETQKTGGCKRCNKKVRVTKKVM